MKCFQAMLLCILLAVCLGGCFQPSSPATANAAQSISASIATTPTPIAKPTATPAPTDNPAYHAVVGNVELIFGGIAITPLVNFLYSTEYRNKGWLCADGISLFLIGYDDGHRKIEQGAPEITGKGPISINIIGSNGALGTCGFYGKKYQSLGYKLQPDANGNITIPDDSQILYGAFTVTWQAQSSPPGETITESSTWEYILKVK